jgi:hypothetical protein
MGFTQDRSATRRPQVQTRASGTGPRHRAATGAPLGVRRYNGPANGFDRVFALAVSPDGRTIYVTGNSPGKASGRDITTIAYRG